MLHPQDLQVGNTLELPELAGRLPFEGQTFRILSLHAGGMGACVHLVQEASGLELALKFVRPDLLDGEAVVFRFEQELTIWLRASVCSLVSEAYAVVRLNEQPAIVAAWLEGGDVSAALAGMSAQSKFECLVRSVRALRWAHENLNIIHLDLKPNNLLLDKSGKSYVADWGLARLLPQAFQDFGFTPGVKLGVKRNSEQTGAFLGTLLYAAPEQILGLKTVDHRADIYALGCMMFEFETGAPPFHGQTAEEIAWKQVYSEPPRLGRWGGKTPLRLQNVISRCLAKDPLNRYQSYGQLEDDLLKIAKECSIDLGRCVPITRYERTWLGRGLNKFEETIESASVRIDDGAIVERGHVHKFEEEAHNLLELGRYVEAEVLLRAFFDPHWLGGHERWHFGHVYALNYAYCLSKIPGSVVDAIEIYDGLRGLNDRPSEFFVNYALALLIHGDARRASEVCEEGLALFPEDFDLLGNYTIALCHLGLLEQAYDSAVRRINLRRDIHSIEEAAAVLGSLIESKKTRDLPAAVKLAEIQSQLISEALAVNPTHGPILLQRIGLIQFAHADASALCVDLINSHNDSVIREFAIVKFLEILASVKAFDLFLEKLQQFKDRMVNEKSRRQLETLEMRVIGENYMIGKDSKAGQRIIIPEVVDYYLGDAGEGGRCQVMQAKVLEWIGRREESLSVLDRFLKANPYDFEGWHASAMIRLRYGNSRGALEAAQTLCEVAPWRAESYDCLGYIAGKLALTDLAKDAQQRGDSVFEREQVLFEELRSKL